MIFKFILLAMFSVLFSGKLFSTEKTYVVTTTPDIAWLFEQVGGEKIIAESLLSGNEDPHFVDAMPHFVAKVAKADVFCMVGLELEIGWAPKVLKKSGNASVQPGGDGFCDASKYIDALDKPKGKIDRSMGDVHAGGNPHYALGPSSFSQASKAILEVLVAVDQKNAPYYETKHKKLTSYLKDLHKKFLAILKPMKKRKILEYHKEFSYFLKDFEITSVGSLEETPGVPPSAGRLAKVSLSSKRNNVSLIIASDTSPKRTLRKFTEISGIRSARVPVGMKTTGSPKTYEGLLDSITKTMLNK